MTPYSRRSLTVVLPLFLLLIFATSLPTCAQQPGSGDVYYYGIEISDQLCGYAEIRLSEGEHDGRPVILLDEEVFAMMTALGSTFNSRQTIRYRIDPETGNFIWHTNDVEQGDTQLGAEYAVHDGAAFFHDIDTKKETRIDLPEGAVLPNTILYPHLLRAFADPATEECSMQVLNVRDGEVQKHTYTRLPDEEIDVNGNPRTAMVIEEMNRKTGLKVRMWIDPETGYFLQGHVLNRRIFRTDPSVVKRVKVADMNSSILVKTNENIGDIQGITKMKVRARLEPVGIWVTEDGLNGPGQSFSGTIDENAIDGVFEISHARYDGTDAPPFPPDFSGSEELRTYIEPSTFCESDDPVLVAKAKEITAGATDAWDAARRLSAWVAENINYAIPGGGTARKTYDVRAGECGAHSMLLTAFCRAVGIPARVVWGCMYTPNLGGSFGQHGWNEIYMGDAGWIPVDATAHEIDFADSGHLRIGEMESTVIALNAEEFEILDYQLGTGEVDVAAVKRLQPYLGTYSSAVVNNKPFEVLEQNGKLGVSIPDKMVLVFNDPGENGLWPCQLAPKLNLSFEKDDDGAIIALKLMEDNRMPRKDTDTEIPDDVPERLRPLLGVFVLTALKADFSIIYETERLCLLEPRGKIYPLQFVKDEGYWEAEDGSRRVRFETENGGPAAAILATHITRLERQ